MHTPGARAWNAVALRRPSRSGLAWSGVTCHVRCMVWLRLPCWRQLWRGYTSASAATLPAPPSWTPPLSLGAGAEPSIRTLPAGSLDQQAAVCRRRPGPGATFGMSMSCVTPTVLSAQGQCTAAAGPGYRWWGLGDLGRPAGSGWEVPGDRLQRAAQHRSGGQLHAARSDSCGESFTNPPSL